MSILRSAAAAGLLAATFLAAALLATTASADVAAELAASDVLSGDASQAPADLCADECCPLWTIQAGAVILHRSNPDEGGDLLRLLDTIGVDDFDFGWTAGLEVAALRRLQSGNSLELRYLGILDWDADDSRQLGPVTVGGDYSTQLNSTELNCRRCAGPHWTWLAGLRIIQLHEEFEFGVDAPPLSLSLLANTDNHLYGGQFGGQLDWCPFAGPLAISGLVKAGVYGNYADVQFSQAGIVNISLPRVDDWNTAFVGELGVVATYPLSDRWSLRGGYQLLYIDGVALATDQPLFVLTPQLDADSSVLYHGAIFGLELAW